MTMYSLRRADALVYGSSDVPVMLTAACLPTTQVAVCLSLRLSACLCVCVCVCVCVCAWTIHKWAQSVRTETRLGGNVDDNNDRLTAFDPGQPG